MITTSLTIEKESRTPAKMFSWKDRKDNHHYPKDMATRHLFYTLLMIWNHFVNENMKIKPFKKYNFSEFYTLEYMTLAVKALAKELATRTDLIPYYVECLDKIKGHINVTYNKTKMVGEKHG